MHRRYTHDRTLPNGMVINGHQFDSALLMALELAINETERGSHTPYHARFPVTERDMAIWRRCAAVLREDGATVERNG